MLTTSVEDDPINIMRNRNNGNTVRLVRSGMNVHSIECKLILQSCIFISLTYLFAFGVMSTESLYT
jgi:hypothetical protein